MLNFQDFFKRELLIIIFLTKENYCVQRCVELLQSFFEGLCLKKQNKTYPVYVFCYWRSALVELMMLLFLHCMTDAILHCNCRNNLSIINACTESVISNCLGNLCCDTIKTICILDRVLKLKLELFYIFAKWKKINYLFLSSDVCDYCRVLVLWCLD